jgi:hypothetical protein
LARLPPSDKPNHFGSPPRRILEREWELYKRPEYARLATISVAQLYNLRHHHRYRERLLHYTKTRPTAVSIGERRKPQPQGQPGFLRLDTVHQGDQPEGGEKGVYHINAVDEVTQWEVAGATRRPDGRQLEVPSAYKGMNSNPDDIRAYQRDHCLASCPRQVLR